MSRCVAVYRLGAPQARVGRISLSKEQLQELSGRESVVMLRLTAARPGSRGGEARPDRSQDTGSSHSRYNHMSAECWPGDHRVKPAVNYWVLQQLQCNCLVCCRPK